MEHSAFRDPPRRRGTLGKLVATAMAIVDRQGLVEIGKSIVELIALIALNRADDCRHIIDRRVDVVD